MNFFISEGAGDNKENGFYLMAGPRLFESAAVSLRRNRSREFALKKWSNR